MARRYPHGKILKWLDSNRPKSPDKPSEKWGLSQAEARLRDAAETGLSPSFAITHSVSPTERAETLWHYTKSSIQLLIRRFGTDATRRERA